MTGTSADRALMKRDREARSRAHAPHSGFRVGAAVRSGSGTIYPGCNVESVTYGLTLCAERVAIFSALSDDDTDIEAVAVAVAKGQAALPCGACRQILIEFAAGARIVLATEDGDLRVLTARELLPGLETGHD